MTKHDESASQAGSYASPRDVVGSASYSAIVKRLGVDQALARQIHATRRRLRQKLEYLDGLLAATQETARRSTPGRILCPTCGAPAIGVRSIQSGETDASFLIVHDHPDGKTCKPPPHPG